MERPKGARRAGAGCGRDAATATRGKEVGADSPLSIRTVHVRTGGSTGSIVRAAARAALAPALHLRRGTPRRPLRSKPGHTPPRSAGA